MGTDGLCNHAGRALGINGKAYESRDSLVVDCPHFYARNWIGQLREHARKDALKEVVLHFIEQTFFHGFVFSR